jgi:pyruvate,water dikinase
MSETCFYIGSGKTDGSTISQKARLLDKAARNGINVPHGSIVRHEALQVALLDGLIQENSDNTYSCHDPRKFIDRLNLPTFGRLMAVRSAFNLDDITPDRVDDDFETVLKVNVNDAADLADALCRVWSSGQEQEHDLRRDIRRDVLIMEMVDAAYGGVALTEAAYEDDLVHYTEGPGNDIVRGKADTGDRLLIPQLWRSEFLSNRDLPDWAQRLQQLLRQIRHVFGRKDWEIEFADDGDTCYLLRILPLAQNSQRNEVFTRAHHKEMLPDLPSVFMADVIESCGDELFRHYRQFDARLPENRPFIKVFKGRPYYNLSLLNDVMRRFGLPADTTEQHIGGDNHENYRARFRRIVVKTLQGVLPRYMLTHLGAVASMNRARGNVDEHMENPGSTFDDLIETVCWLYATRTREMILLTASIVPLTHLLKRLHALDEHSLRHETISTRLYTDQQLMRDYARRDDDLRDTLQSGDMPDNEYFKHLWKYYEKRYGHRGIYENDIARPRFQDAPESLLSSLTQPYQKRQTPHTTFTAWFTTPLWWLTGRALDAREDWQHHMMQAFREVRQALMERAAHFVDEGVLPEADCIWQMHLDELKQLEAGWQPDDDFFQQRRAERDTLKKYEMPATLRRFDDLERYYAGDKNIPRRQRFQGVRLTHGTMEGTAWVLDDPAGELPEGFQPENTILVARCMDAGWIPTLALVRGVAVEAGNDVSPGAVILREMGFPAVTGVRSITKVIQTGDKIRLRADKGAVELIQRVNDPQSDHQNDETPESAVLVS